MNASASLAGGQPDVAAIVRPYGVGLDCHSRFVSVCVLCQVGGEVLRYEAEFGTEIAQLAEARSWAMEKLTAHGIAHEPFTYVLESTGCYHIPVIHVLGGRACVVNPLLAGPYRRKTDRLDARTLAYHGMSGLWPISYFPSTDVIAFRVLVLRRRQLVRERTRLGNQVNNILLRFGHTLGSKGSLLTGELRGIAEDLCRGQLRVAHPCISSVPMPAAVGREVCAIYERWDQLRGLIASVEKEIVSFAEGMTWETFESSLPGKEMLELLQTVPGVGPVTSAVWLAEIVTPRRFPSPKALTAYIGCDPSLKVSAGKVTEHVKRKGNGNVHACLVQSAQSLVSFRREAFGIWGYSIACKHAKGGWQKAVGAVARRVGLGLYWVQRTGTPFTYDLYNLTVRRETLQDEPLANLPFSDRVKRLFVIYSVRTTHDLVDGVENGLLKKRGFGPVAKKEIVSWLQNVRVGRKQKVPTPNARRKDRPAPSPTKGCSSAGGSLPGIAANGRLTRAKGRQSAIPTESSPGSTSSSSTPGTKNRSRSDRTSRKSPCRSGPSRGGTGRKQD